MGRSIIAFPFLLIPLSSICSPDSTYVCTAQYHKIFILFVLCIVFVCFNGASARFSQQRPIPIENGNLSMPENLVKTSTYALSLSTQTLRVGLKNSVGIEKEVSDICVAVPFDEKLTILWTTQGVARVKIWCEVSWVRVTTKFSEINS